VAPGEPKSFDGVFPMKVREITAELNRRGIPIDKMSLNQILWKENNRAELVVDNQTFRWRYDVQAAEEKLKIEVRQQEIEGQLATKAAFLEFWKGIGFDFLGVERKGSPKPFFFLRSDGDCLWVVGPTGNLLREKTTLCSDPEEMDPNSFTPEQLNKAAEEILKERRREQIEEHRRMIGLMSETELLAPEVYVGPTIERVQDVIPVDGMIFVANVMRISPRTATFGWGVVFVPIYLVVNILGSSVEPDSRYGVFKICFYDLIKRKLTVESEGNLELKLHYEAGKVVIRNGAQLLPLE
jgi:hypothetical protein